MRWTFALLLAACGGSSPPSAVTGRCGEEARAEVYVAGLEKAGKDGRLKFRLAEATPAPPDRGDNSWRLEVLDAAGAAVSTATVGARAWMPDHGHGTTPLDHRARRSGGGFELGPMNFFMPGFWTVTVRAEGAGGDEAVFAFCLEG